MSRRGDRHCRHFAAARLVVARLAVQESLRRRVLVVFGVFILILLFAGWYLDRESIDPCGCISTSC